MTPEQYLEKLIAACESKEDWLMDEFMCEHEIDRETNKCMLCDADCADSEEYL